jgi:hypothetical protein
MASNGLAAVDSSHPPIVDQQLSIGHQSQTLPRSDTMASFGAVWWRELTAPIVHQNRRQAYECSYAPGLSHFGLCSCGPVRFVGLGGLNCGWEVPLFWVKCSAHTGRQVIFSSPPSPGQCEGVSYSAVTLALRCDVDNDMVCDRR